MNSHFFRRLSRFFQRPLVIRLGMLLALIAIAVLALWLFMIQMPGQSYSGPLPQLTPEEIELRETLKNEVRTFSETIGPRNYGHLENLDQTKAYLEDTFEKYGYEVTEQNFSTPNGDRYTNLSVEITGRDKPDEIIVVGGHYDSAFNTPGANDNGTGTAATLELSKLLANTAPKRTLRFIAFTNEEPPFFWTDNMGSLVYAKNAKESNQKIVAMLSMETMGFYSKQPDSQRYLFPLNKLYPTQGNFIAFIGNLGSGYLVRDAIASFRNYAQIPSEGVSLPASIPGVGWSDQWSFWQQGYPGIMVTDTAPYRYPHYHTKNDTLDKIDFDRFAHVVMSLSKVIQDLANA